MPPPTPAVEPLTTFEFNELIGRLRAAYPAFRFPPRSMDVYRSHLLPVDQELADAACDQWVATSRYFPTVAELLTTVREVTPPEHRPKVPECARCDGTGLVETEPRPGEDGEPFPRVEAGWVRKCPACRGRGRVRLVVA